MATPQPGSAVALVRSILTAHPLLRTPALFRLGTSDVRPVLPEMQQIDTHGRVRMKTVSNMREGKRIWVPPPVARFPGHPFRSMNYLKSNVLRTLEEMNLIRLAKIRQPLETDEERREAVHHAAKLTRRRERAAIKAHDTPPPPVPPSLTKDVFAWTLLPLAPDVVAQLSSTAIAAEQHALSHPEEPFEPPSAPTRDTMGAQERDAAWARAVALEGNFLAQETLESQAIAARREERAERWKQQRERDKAQRERDKETGMYEVKAREARRLAAVEQVRQYAEQTGEDVSEWFRELGEGPRMDRAAFRATAASQVDAERGVYPGREADADVDMDMDEGVGRYREEDLSHEERLRRRLIRGEDWKDVFDVRRVHAEVALDADAADGRARVNDGGNGNDYNDDSVNPRALTAAERVNQSLAHLDAKEQHEEVQLQTQEESDRLVTSWQVADNLGRGAKPKPSPYPTFGMRMTGRAPERDRGDAARELKRDATQRLFARSDAPNVAAAAFAGDCRSPSFGADPRSSERTFGGNRDANDGGAGASAGRGGYGGGGGGSGRGYGGDLARGGRGGLGFGQRTAGGPTREPRASFLDRQRGGGEHGRYRDQGGQNGHERGSERRPHRPGSAERRAAYQGQARSYSD